MVSKTIAGSLFMFVSFPFAISTIKVFPSCPNNVLASGYSGLTLNAQFPEQTRGGTACRWKYSGVFHNEVFASRGTCIKSTATVRNETITCLNHVLINGTYHTLTNLSIHRPIATNLSISISCINGFTVKLPFQTVTACTVTNPYIIENCTGSCGYMSTAQISCMSGYKPSVTSSICGACATFDSFPECTKAAASATCGPSWLVPIIVIWIVGITALE